MSAPEEDTFAEEGGEMEEMDEAGSDEEEGEDMEEDGADGEAGRKVYVPGIEPLKPGEELEMDRSAYRMYHECQTGKSKRAEAPTSPRSAGRDPQCEFSSPVFWLCRLCVQVPRV